MPPGEPILKDLAAEIKVQEAEAEEVKVLKTFARSKIVTDEVRRLYLENRDNRDFVRRCGRSLVHADPEQFSAWLAMLDKDILENPRSSCTPISFTLRAMISEPEKLRAEIMLLCPTEATFDLSNMDSESEGILKRTGLVGSLRHFNDSDLASEMIMPFMKGDYLNHALSSFHYHLCRLPTPKVANYLQEHIP